MPVLFGIGAAAAAGLSARLIGFDRDRAFYPVVLTVIASYYVLFGVMAGAGADLIVDLATFALFAAVAAVGFRTSLWVVVAGLAMHGLFDLGRDLLPGGEGVPAWWPSFCLAYDLAAALGLAAILVLRRRTA